MVKKSENGLKEMTGNSDQGKGPLFGAIEAGGTKFVCGVGSCLSDIRINEQPTENRKEFKTEDGPEIVFANVVKWFREMEKKLGRNISAMGVASFGPVDLNENNKDSFGCIKSTPRLSWRGVNFLQPFRTEFGHALPIGLLISNKAPQI